MTNTMKTAKMYRLFYTRALADARAWFAQYDADVRDWYENGEGAAPEWVTDECDGHESLAGEHMGEAVYCDGSCQRAYNVGGQGHTYPSCIHGMSRWTDYDNICGGCEDGDNVFAIASVDARSAWLRFCDRWEFSVNAPQDLPAELRTGIANWAFAQFTENTPQA